MSKYRVTLTLPGFENSPIVNVTVEAGDEDAAIDLGFDEAFRQYPQFGAFQIDAVDELAA